MRCVLYSEAAGAAAGAFFFAAGRFAAVVTGAFLPVRRLASRVFFFTCAFRRFIFIELRRSNFPMRGDLALRI
jgi:hypothetical protein